jgi:hypothetical protein
VTKQLLCIYVLISKVANYPISILIFDDLSEILC